MLDDNRCLGGSFCGVIKIALLALALASVLFLPGCDWDSFTKRAINPYPGEAASIVRGQALFLQVCTSCHGQAGQGDGPASQSFSERLPDFTNRVRMVNRGDPDLFWAISRGRADGLMPSFQNQLSEPEIWDLVNYIRSLHSAAP